MGWVVLATTAGCDLLQDRFNGRSRVLALLALFAPLAVCVNPYGIAYGEAFLPVANSSFSHILEWMPPWRGPPLPMDRVIPAAILTALAVAAWMLNPNRRLAHLGWLLLFGAMFALARRNISPFSLVCLLVLATNARSLDPERWWQACGRLVRRKPAGEDLALASLMRWLSRTGLAAWLALEFLFLWIHFQAWQPLVPTRLERGIVRFIEKEKLADRLFNDYENSSYLQWRLAGQPKLYIDLLNAYPDHVLQDYRAIIDATERGRGLLEAQQIEVVVLTCDRGGGRSLASLAEYLDANHGWARVYVGKDGVIWVRRTAKYAPVGVANSESQSGVVRDAGTLGLGKPGHRAGARSGRRGRWGEAVRPLAVLFILVVGVSDFFFGGHGDDHQDVSSLLPRQVGCQEFVDQLLALHGIHAAKSLRGDNPDDPIVVAEFHLVGGREVFFQHLLEFLNYCH